MLRPFLFIGIGGSGGKTLRTLREDLQHRLDRAGWDRPFPAAWQLLHLDVPTHADGDDPDLPPQLPAADYEGLVGPDITYKVIDRALTDRAAHSAEITEALAGWRPDPMRVEVNVEKGAGQYRTLGRIIAVTRAAEIRHHLDRAIARLAGPEVAAELADLARAFGSDVSADPPSPVPVLVASLAGGSGAGAFLDVADILRATGAGWADGSIAFLHCPDVFDHLPPEKRKGVQANALASISELLAGFWNVDVPRVGEPALLERAGIALGEVDRRGPRFPFLVGAANNRITFAHQNDVYRALGTALAAWATSDRLQDQVVAYTSANWSQSSAVPDALPLRAPGQEVPFAAAGFARITLGRDRFADYTAERLARAALDRLVRHHLTAVPDAANDAVAVEQVATGAFARFLADSGLDERGDEHNDVLDALRPTDRDDRVRSLADEVHTAVVQGRRDAAASSAWVDQILVDLDARTAAFHDAERVGRLERARRWVTDIQDRLDALVTRTAATQGLPVTEELLRRLERELTDVCAELPNEADLNRRWASTRRETVAGALAAAGGQPVTPDNPWITDAVRAGAECVEYRAEADLRDLAVRLLADLRDHLVAPLRKAVAGARAQLLADETTTVAGRAPRPAGWPEGERVPGRFRPAPNEFPVDPLDDWPATFAALVTRAVTTTDGRGAAVSPGDAQGRAVTQLVVGDAPGETGPLGGRALARTTSWVPTLGELQGDEDSARPARYLTRLGAADLLGRARAWVARPDTPLGRHVRQSLAAHLDPETVDEADLAARLDRFEAAVIKAVDAAAPLVEVDVATLQRTHGRDRTAWTLTFSALPFAEGTPARQRIERVLHDKGLWSDAVARAFADGHQADIDVFSLTDEPYQPVVFSSVVRPIADEWTARAHSPDQRGDFWKWRRARPLPQFVPTAPEVRRAMIRGWFTAALLGRVVDGDRPGLVVPAEGRVVGFPHPLLGPAVTEGYDLLPAVLESLPIALVLYAAGGAGADGLVPYTELRRLGRDAADADGTYARPNPALADWVVHGTVEKAAPLPAAERAGDPGGEPDERRAACQAWFEDLAKRYQEELDLVEERGPLGHAPRAWELRHDIRAALDDLVRALGHIRPDAEGWV